VEYAHQHHLMKPPLQPPFFEQVNVVVLQILVRQEDGI
jgi:hypothetical protein